MSSGLPGVTYIGNFISKGIGAWQYCEDLARRFEEDGIVVTRSSSRIQPVFRLGEMVVEAGRAGRRGDIVLIDVFSTRAFLWAEWASIAARRAGSVVVGVLRGGLLPERAGRSRRRTAAFLARCSAVVTPSKYLMAEMQRFSSQKISYIPNALDLGKYCFRERSMAQPRLVWLRAFSARYRPDVAIRAVAEIVQDHPELQLQMGGPDRGDGSLDSSRALIRDLGIGDNVRIVGNISKEIVPEFLQRGDILLNTTEAESFGVAVMEAAACGLCIVSTSVGEIPRLWEDGQDALLVPAGDVKAMSAAVRSLFLKPDLVARLSRNARARAEQFSWDRVIPLWRRLFRDVCSA